MNREEYPLHDSMRGFFGRELFFAMRDNEDIILLIGDLGYGLFDMHRKYFPDRCINTGAAEQTLLDMSVGLALEGKIPVVYSITTFLLYRPFETIRTYINYENIPVKLIGGGRDKDYSHDGISHWSEDAKEILDTQRNIKQYWPESKEEMNYEFMKEFLENGKPSFLSLRR